MDRRSFVSGTVYTVGILALGATTKYLEKNDALLRPPGGQDEERFIGACVRCDKCRSACPQTCITTAALENGIINARTPRIDFHKGYCTFCNACIQVCPTTSLISFNPQTQSIGKARLDEEQCVNCGKCVPACDYQALTWDEDKKLPIIDESACNGCGKCEYICPSTSYGYYNGTQQRAIYVERI